MAYEPRYAISNKYEVIFGAQFHILALKALVKNHQSNIFETKIIVMGGTWGSLEFWYCIIFPYARGN